MGACILMHPRVLACGRVILGVSYIVVTPYWLGGVPLKGFVVYVYCACFAW